MKKTLLLSLIFASAIPSVYAFREMKPMTDGQIRSHIIDGILQSYEGDCPCPFSKNKLTGKPCGDDSEYFRTRGRILCYPRDVSDAEVNFYRQKYMISDPKADPNGQLNFGINPLPSDSDIGTDAGTTNPNASGDTGSGTSPQ